MIKEKPKTAVKRKIDNEATSTLKLKERRKKRNEILSKENVIDPKSTDFETIRVGLGWEMLSPEVQVALETTPQWYIELFNYIHLFDELKIDVCKESVEKSHFKNDKFKASYLERQLFLIFECLPKTRSGLRDKLTQKEFARCSWLSETILALWKRQEWFWWNRVRLMKRIFSLHTPDVIEALYLGSTTSINAFGMKDAKCIKLWLEYVENHTFGLDLTSRGEWITIQFASGPSNFIKVPEIEEWIEKPNEE